MVRVSLVLYYSPSPVPCGRKFTTPRTYMTIKGHFE